MKRDFIAVIGATGFVGSALCERLHAEERPFIACLRSPESANRVARIATPIRIFDLLEFSQVEAALKGCKVVVNCALGDEFARSKGLKNLLTGAKKTGVEKIIHLSDMAIYGEDPDPESVSEKCRPTPMREPTGVSKLKQDKLVLGLKDSGIATYILCPGNITGPYSPFLRRLIERLCRGTMPLVDGGQNPSNVTHIDNLIEAILTAIDSNHGAGERYFVNETEPIPWKRVFDDITRLTGIDCEYVDAKREQVLQHLPEKKRSNGGLKSSAEVILSSKFRDQVTRLPMLGWMDRQAKKAYRQLPKMQRRALREKLNWPIQIEAFPARPSLDDRFVKMQIKRYHHSPAKLQSTLGWIPPLNYEQGLEVTEAWLQFAGLDTRFATSASRST
ncbi:MAG: NAD(P)-dependent oxidoreductase [Candidatus Zixiibacteriota bacterium]